MIQHTEALFDEVLTKRAIALLEDREDFAVMNGAIPMLPTGGALLGNYKVWKASDFRRRNIVRRASGTDFKRADLGLESKAFRLEQMGYEIAVDDRDYIPGQLEDTSAKMVEDAYANLDIELASLLNTTNFTNYTAVTNAWDTATGTPIEDVQNAIKVVKGRLGVAPNSMLISEDVYYALLNNAEILARMKTTADKIITKEVLASFFGLRNLYVMAGYETTTADGQPTQTIGAITTGKCLVYFKGESGVTSPSAIKCFYNDNESRGLAIIETYRDNFKRADIVRVIQDFDIVVTMVDGAQLLTNVVS